MHVSWGGSISLLLKKVPKTFGNRKNIYLKKFCNFNELNRFDSRLIKVRQISEYQMVCPKKHIRETFDHHGEGSNSYETCYCRGDECTLYMNLRIEQELELDSS